MKGGQRRTLVAGSLVIVGMLLFPPYKIEFQPDATGRGPEETTVLIPIWDAPEQRTYLPGELTYETMHVRSATLDVATLLIEIMAVAVVCGIGIALLGRRRGKATA
jgi:hypothetical protein